MITRRGWLTSIALAPFLASVRAWRPVRAVVSAVRAQRTWYVGPGQWPTIASVMSLVGAGDTVIVGSSHVELVSTILIQGNGVKIRGLTFSGDDTLPPLQITTDHVLILGEMMERPT